MFWSPLPRVASNWHPSGLHFPPVEFIGSVPPSLASMEWSWDLTQYLVHSRLAHSQLSHTRLLCWSLLCWWLTQPLFPPNWMKICWVSHGDCGSDDVARQECLLVCDSDIWEWYRGEKRITELAVWKENVCVWCVCVMHIILSIYSKYFKAYLYKHSKLVIF